MDEREFLKKCKLQRNPFPPAAAGIDTEEGLYIPKSWERKISEYYGFLRGGGGPKAFPIVGSYGSGKTVLLRYLKKYFEKERILSFYFDNPGLQFYDLANTLMRGIGRHEFAKALWELCKPHMSKAAQLSLFPMSFSDWISTLRTKAEREARARELKTIIIENLELTRDEEVAYRMALTVIETASKPYFEYRDFVAGGKSSLVAEKEEAKYFKAIIKTILSIYDVLGVAFLIDEFEEVAIPKRMPARKVHEYLATLRRFISISETEPLWVILSMTPEAADTTKEQEPALWARFTRSESHRLDLEPLKQEEAKKLLIWWLDRARPNESDKNQLFPFPDNIETLIERRLLYPRALVRIGFAMLSVAELEGVSPPFQPEFVKKVIEDMYPSKKESDG